MTDRARRKRHQHSVMEATLMKVLKVISATAMFLLLGAITPAFVQEEHHDEAAKPTEHQEAAKPAKQQEAKPAKQEQAKPAKQQEESKAQPEKQRSQAQPANQQNKKTSRSRPNNSSRLSLKIRNSAAITAANMGSRRELRKRSRGNVRPPLY